MASGYRVFFSGDCSGVKDSKGQQHGIELAIKVGKLGRFFFKDWGRFRARTVRGCFHLQGCVTG